jgi:hypothetical protein
MHKEYLFSYLFCLLYLYHDHLSYPTEVLELLFGVNCVRKACSCFDNMGIVLRFWCFECFSECKACRAKGKKYVYISMSIR